MSEEFWDQQCPQRPFGLTHQPHDDWQNKCAECGMLRPLTLKKEPAQPAEPSNMADHIYIGTITGHCAHKGCGRKQDAHPVVAEVSRRPDGSCGVPHDSLQIARLIGDEGEEWRRCPVCNVLIEPRLATGEVTGNPYDPGRGSLTDRLKKKLTGWAGWVDFNGGGR